ncbi:hypothetical protein E4T56_gene20905 [Termitomyces sp. T112]|nr:hypothetical protein E4T56_gene20905 [Termitomyces sp. T112]
MKRGFLNTGKARKPTLVTKPTNDPCGPDVGIFELADIKGTHPAVALDLAQLGSGQVVVKLPAEKSDAPK